LATGISKTRWINNGGAINGSKETSNVTLCYENKQPKNLVLQTPPAYTQFVKQFGSISNLNDWQNRLYFGENLSILASLLNDDSVAGKVRLVYIDPPFATKSVFQSRSMDDAYCDLLSGAEYIEFMRQRLILLRELLADDGSIYVHLDENMAFHIKIIMDEVFGSNNYRNWITRKKCNPKNYTHKTYGNTSDFILFYTKTDKYVWNRPFVDWTKEAGEKEYPYIEQATGRRFKKVPIHAPGVRNGETGKTWRGMNPPPGKHWQFLPQKLDEMDARGEIFWSSNGNPRRKIYLENNKGIPVQDIWIDYKDAHNQNIKITGYPTEKNAGLLSRIIEASSNVGDIVLDCFSGSGTSLNVSTELNRKWIGIDNSSEAIKTTLKRFQEGVKPMGDFVSKNPQTKTIPSLPLENSCVGFALYAEESRISHTEVF
jgi:adenine-specific DNA-methyltransferase